MKLVILSRPVYDRPHARMMFAAVKPLHPERKDSLVLRSLVRLILGVLALALLIVWAWGPRG